MKTHTKIICTIGPACQTLTDILALIDAGMNVARLNFSHGTQKEHAKMIAILKEARRIRDQPLAIMLDTQGPEIRIGKIRGGSFAVKARDQLLLVTEAIEGSHEKISITPAKACDALKIGQQVFFDNGYVSAHVIACREEGILVEIDNPGTLSSNKSVNLPNCNIDLPAMTEQDKSDIVFGCNQQVDLIAASFIRSAEHLLAIKRLIAEAGAPHTQIIAKIENEQGVSCFDQILQVADGIMIARGDLGVELPLKKIPPLQKMMIRKCCAAGKPVITATQMLETMITNPRPTRAEVSDVANAIYDSTSSVMLSGETAVGRYPNLTVQVMSGIVQEAESDFNYKEFFTNDARTTFKDVTSAITQAAVRTAYHTEAKAILVFTATGATARLLSRFRPQMPIIALTPSERTYHQMALNWGVIPLYEPHCHSSEEAFYAATRFARERGYASYGDLVVVIAGIPFGIPGTTNLLLVDSIGDVLLRSHRGFGRPHHGKVTLLTDTAGISPSEVKDRFLVISKVSESLLPYLQVCRGVILQNSIEDLASEEFILEIAKNLDLPVIVRAESAFCILHEGDEVTLEPERGLIYQGIIPLQGSSPK